jgi:hypothetical protein
MLLVGRKLYLIHWSSQEIYIIRTKRTAQVDTTIVWTKGALDRTSTPPQVKQKVETGLHTAGFCILLFNNKSCLGSRLRLKIIYS